MKSILIYMALGLLLINNAHAQVERSLSGETKVISTQAILQQSHTSTTVVATGLDSVYHVAWSPDSKCFAVIGSKGRGDHMAYFVVYDASSNTAIQKLPVNVSSPGSLLGGITFSPDGKYLAAGIGVITLWETKTWKPIRDIEGPYADMPAQRAFGSSGVNSLIFSPDSKSLSVLYESVSYWPASAKNRTKEVAATLMALESSSKRDGTFWEKLAKNEIAKSLGTIIGFDVETNKVLFVQACADQTPEKSARFTGNLTYTADGKYLVSSRIEQHQLKIDEHYRHFTFVEFRDPQTGRIVQEIADPHVMQVTAVVGSHDGKYLATGTNTRSKESTLNQFTKSWDPIDNQDPIRLWEVVSRKMIAEYGPLRGAVRSLVFSADDNLLVSCQTDLEKKETVWLWDLKTGQVIDRVPTPLSGTEFFGCALSPNDHTIVIPVIGKLYLISVVGTNVNLKKMPIDTDQVRLFSSPHEY